MTLHEERIQNKKYFTNLHAFHIFTYYSIEHNMLFLPYVRRENRFAVYSGNAGFEQHNLKALLSERKKKQ